MTRYPCRCSKCRARKTLAMSPDWYEQPPTCSCGGVYKVDTYRRKIERKKYNCGCDGYPWQATNGPHRKGSLHCAYYRGPATAS